MQDTLTAAIARARHEAVLEAVRQVGVPLSPQFLFVTQSQLDGLLEPVRERLAEKGEIDHHVCYEGMRIVVVAHDALVGVAGFVRDRQGVEKSWHVRIRWE